MGEGRRKSAQRGRAQFADAFLKKATLDLTVVIEMDRLNAIRLLQALIAAGKDCSAPMAKAWINKKAWEIGLERYELPRVLGYAGNEGWIVDPLEGWISLTSKGEAAARAK